MTRMRMGMREDASARPVPSRRPMRTEYLGAVTRRIGWPDPIGHGHDRLWKRQGEDE